MGHIPLSQAGIPDPREWIWDPPSQSSGFAAASPHPFCAELWICSSISTSFLCWDLDFIQQLYVLFVFSPGFVPAAPHPFCVEFWICSSISMSFLCGAPDMLQHLHIVFVLEFWIYSTSFLGWSPWSWGLPWAVRPLCWVVVNSSTIHIPIPSVQGCPRTRRLSSSSSFKDNNQTFWHLGQLQSIFLKIIDFCTTYKEKKPSEIFKWPSIFCP